MTERALESSHFAARFVAEAVARQIDRRWTTLEQAAADPALPEMIRRAAAGDTGINLQLQHWIEKLSERQRRPECGKLVHFG